MTWERDGDLCVFPITFAFVDGSLSIFRMANAISGAESALTAGLRKSILGRENFLPFDAKNSAILSMEL